MTDTSINRPDYIPLPGEAAAEVEERKEWMKSHPDSQKTYIFDVNIPSLGGIVRDRATAYTQADAIEKSISQWGLLGINLIENDFKVVEVM